MLKRWLASVFLGVTLFSAAAATLPSQKAMACGPNDTFLGGIKAWHYYMPCDGDSVSNDIQLNQLWLIALAVFESILFAGGVAAVVFIIWGGVKYVTSQGSPDSTASARRTIVNAIAGLVISISAAVLVQFLIRLLAPGGLNRAPGLLDIPNASQAGIVPRILSFAYAVIGSVAVIYVVIGSIKFATSTGDPGKAASARNTIIYAIVGLVVAISASVITSFVISEV